MINRIALSSGIIIPLWLFIGVAIAGSFYPDYSHFNQALSELGASGAPTNKISPAINNYPLGVLFIVFGLAISLIHTQSKLAIFSGLLIILHGIASIIAGYFSCDPGCMPAKPSMSQITHNLSGLVMFVSITLSNAIWVYIAKKHSLILFYWFSIACLIISLIAAFLLPIAVNYGIAFGFLQRVNYGVSVIWLAGLAYISLKSVRLSG